MISSNPDPVSINDRSHLEELKSLYQNISWENEEMRLELLFRLANLFGDWTGTLPNLKEIFQPNKIDQLLLDTVNSMIADTRNYEELYRFIDFVVRTGYKDEPIVGIDDKPLSRRTTEVHRLAYVKLVSNVFHNLFGVLFEICDKCHVNYVDGEFSITHFHAACRLGCEDVVVKFLELGQDPNCLVPKVDISPLHMALVGNCGKRTIE
uniref:Uncharacterized protein n=1 Tax=Trichogramma kaykai TaxID=54128 RepID=A0ABD2WGB4_9HYME